MRRVNTWEGAVEIDHSPNGALVFYMPPHSHGKGSAFSPSEARQLGAALTEEARAAQREKNTKVRRAVVRENPSAAPWVIGALALAGAAIWYLSKDKTAAASTTTTPGQLPPAVQCTVDQLRLTQWGVGAGVAAFYTPMIGIQDPVNAGTAFDILPSEISSQIDKLPSAASVVLVDKNNVFHYFANDSTPSVRRDDLFADYCTKFGKTTLSGFHPASTFML